MRAASSGWQASDVLPKKMKVSFPRPIPKERCVVVIPPNLASFFREVANAIREDSPFATTPSDDLLQCDYAYGGLGQGSPPVYHFTYFSASDVDPKSKWHLSLTADEVSSVAEGSTGELSLWGCTSEACESKYPSEDSLCHVCDYVRNEDAEKFTPEEIAEGQRISDGIKSDFAASVKERMETESEFGDLMRGMLERAKAAGFEIPKELDDEG